ncbi:MAG: hypothetical protein ACE5H4_16175 [Candidatus Thorarchaeota archaeon]
MRIKAVLRDSDILSMGPGSKERINAVAKKNLDRVVNLASFLKVMGLGHEDRVTMLNTLAETKFHIWLLQEHDHDLILLSEKETPESLEIAGFKWQ